MRPLTLPLKLTVVTINFISAHHLPKQDEQRNTHEEPWLKLPNSPLKKPNQLNNQAVSCPQLVVDVAGGKYVHVSSSPSEPPSQVCTDSWSSQVMRQYWSNEV